MFHIGYNPKIGDTRSERYRFILDLYDKSYGNLIKSESKSESEIEEEEIISSASGLKNNIIILDSDPNELVNKLRILNQEKIAGNDSKLINTHIEAIVDQLLKLNVINTKKHSNILNL